MICKIFGKPVILMFVVACLVVLSSSTADAVTVKEVCAVDSSCYAIDANGDLWAWGNVLGQKHVHPTKLSFIDHVKMVASSTGGVVVLKDDGSVWAWGTVPASQTGHYPGENSTTPVRINISGVTYVASSGLTVYMVKSDGSLWMCGRELCLSFNDLRHPEYALDPVRLPISNVSKVVPTSSFVYVEKDDGSWWSWGENYDYQLNDGTNVSRDSPVQMLKDNIKSVCAQSACYSINDYYISASSVLALDNSGQVYGWGDNSKWVSGDSMYPTFSGMNADGDYLGYIVNSPHPVPGMSRVREIGCGIGYYVALKKDGSVWAWGSNPYCHDGQSSLDSNMPVQLSGFSDIVTISVGDNHLLAVKKDGTVWTWGSNIFGQIGNGEFSPNGGKPYAMQVPDLYVDLPAGTDASPATSTPAPVPTYTAIPDVEDNSTETSTPIAVGTVSSTPVPLPSVTPEASPGFGFNNIAGLCSLLAIIGLLTGFMQRKDG